MRQVLVFVVLGSAIACAAESSSASMREKLHTKIMESWPPSPPTKPQEENKAEDPPPFLMKPVTVESNRYRDVVTRIEREEQKEMVEKFSPVSGGTLYKKDLGRRRVELGGWWNPRQG